MTWQIRLYLAASCLVASALALAEPFPSTYEPLASQPTLIENAVILTGTGERLEGASLLMDGGKLSFVGSGCLLYTSPSPRDGLLSRMPSSA